MGSSYPASAPAPSRFGRSSSVGPPPGPCPRWRGHRQRSRRGRSVAWAAPRPGSQIGCAGQRLRALPDQAQALEPHSPERSPKDVGRAASDPADHVSPLPPSSRIACEGATLRLTASTYLQLQASLHGRYQISMIFTDSNNIKISFYADRAVLSLKTLGYRPGFTTERSLFGFDISRSAAHWRLRKRSRDLPFRCTQDAPPAPRSASAWVNRCVPYRRGTAKCGRRPTPLSCPSVNAARGGRRGRSTQGESRQTGAGSRPTPTGRVGPARNPWHRG